MTKIAKKFMHELDDMPYDKVQAQNPNGPKPCFEHKQLAISGTTIRKVLGIGPCQFVGVALDFLLGQVAGTDTTLAGEMTDCDTVTALTSTTVAYLKTLYDNTDADASIVYDALNDTTQSIDGAT